MKCQICKCAPVEWSWQPFGPGEPLTFITLGSHYRGFAVVKVCDNCKRELEAGATIEFAHSGHCYRYDGTTVHWLRPKSGAAAGGM